MIIKSLLRRNQNVRESGTNVQHISGLMAHFKDKWLEFTRLVFLSQTLMYIQYI